MIPDKTLINFLAILTKSSISSFDRHVALATLFLQQSPNLPPQHRELLLSAIEDDKQRIKSLQDVLRALPN
jgi:hypothetical protein